MGNYIIKHAYEMIKLVYRERERRDGMSEAWTAVETFADRYAQLQAENAQLKVELEEIREHSHATMQDFADLLGVEPHHCTAWGDLYRRIGELKAELATATLVKNQHTETLRGIAGMPGCDGERMKLWASDSLQGYTETLDCTILKLQEQLATARHLQESAEIALNTHMQRHAVLANDLRKSKEREERILSLLRRCRDILQWEGAAYTILQEDIAEALVEETGT